MESYIPWAHCSQQDTFSIAKERSAGTERRGLVLARHRLSIQLTAKERKPRRPISNLLRTSKIASRKDSATLEAPSCKYGMVVENSPLASVLAMARFFKKRPWRNAF